MEKQKLSRITVDISEEEHKMFKVLAAILDKSMRELIVESIQKNIVLFEEANKGMQQLGLAHISEWRKWVKTRD